MIIPGIYENEITEVITLLKIFGSHAKTIQLDISDGLFVPRKTYSNLSFLENFDTKDFTSELQLHLMVQKPESYIFSLPKNVKDICAHAESFLSKPLYLNEFYELVKAKGLRCGICFNPETSIDDFKDAIEKCDYVQFMSVNPGNQGGEFLPEVFDKVKNFRKDNPQKAIQLDGGISLDKISECVSFGADSLVIGSRIVKMQNPLQAYDKFMLEFTHARNHVLNN